MVNLTQYCQEHLGYDIKSNRVEIEGRCGWTMLEHLYNAVVGWSPEQGKLSSALTPAQALSMRDAFNSYTAESDSDKSNAERMAEAWKSMDETLFAVFEWCLGRKAYVG